MDENEQLKERITHLEKIENPKEMQNRYDRYKMFDNFHKYVNETFERFRDKDKRAILYQAYNTLCVCPGSRAGMDRKDIVEIFWGHKLYDSEYKDSNIKHFKFLKETGACLSFIRKDDGFVTVYLDPAYTDKSAPTTESIIISRNLNPKKLELERTLKCFWIQFMAFTEVTHLDGKPSLWQKLLIHWLRFVKPTFKNGEIRTPRYLTNIYTICKWVLTIGLSGALLAIIQLWNDSENKNSAYIEEIKNEVVQMDSINQAQAKQIDKIGQRIDTIDCRLQKLPDDISKSHNQTKN